jgi:AAA15 family ATPase/GTPase
MLIEFAVENFRSIKDRAVLSMVATTDKSLPNNVIESKVLNKDKLLRGAVIYGANASGKTNVIMALNGLRNLVLFSHNKQLGMPMDCNPFKLDKKSLSRPTAFHIVFIKDDVKYRYDVTLTNQKILEEHLYYYPNSRQALIFARKNTHDYQFSIDAKEQNLNAQRTPENVLYLSRATQLNYAKTKPVFDWFVNNLQTIGPTEHPVLQDITADMLKDPKLKTLIIKAMKEADIDVDDITMKVTEMNILKFPVMLQNILQVQKDGKSTIKAREILLYHRGVPFNLEYEESEGTKRLFNLIGPLIAALMNGRILVVDELDTKLHHLLNVFLINLIHDPAQNKSNAQLIFTTHNVNLLDLDLFRRDQIWFTEKSPKTGATVLYSLAEFSARKGQDIEKGYLLGKFGAVPFIPTRSI